MDANTRRLTERHWHISRRFGVQRTTIFQFESCNDQPLANTATAQRLEWKYPKEDFKYYKSAEVHTVQPRIPGRVPQLESEGLQVLQSASHAPG